MDLGKLKEHEILEVVDRHRVLGRGYYARVFEVSVQGSRCAAKEIKFILQEFWGRKFIEECILLSKLRHNNIVQFYGVYRPPKLTACPSPLPWLIMEYLPFDLHSFLLRPVVIPLSVKLSMLFDVSKGLTFLHNCKEVVHRDLAACNVLITPSLDAKIADFGASRVIKSLDNTLSMNPGNPRYMPPECSGFSLHYDSKIDIFSLGVIMLFTMIQKFPEVILPHAFVENGKQFPRTEVQRRSQYFEIVDRSQDPAIAALNKLCQRCLQNEPNDRPEIEVVIEELLRISRDYPDDLLAMDKLKLLMTIREAEKGKRQDREELENKQVKRQRLQIEEVSKAEMVQAHVNKESGVPASADQIAATVGIDSKQLDEPACSEDLLLRISRLLPNWMEYAVPLKLTPQETNGINTDAQLTYAMKAYELLKTWYRKNAYTDWCHYRVLVETSCELGHADVAGKICEIIKDFQSETTEESSVVHISKGLALFKRNAIGSGAFGTVLKGEINGRPCALKVLHALATEINMSIPATATVKNSYIERFKEECKYLESFKHKNIVRHLATRTHPKSGHLVLALELMDCNLRQFFSSPSGRDLPFPTQTSLCHDIASALVYIHSRHIVHRDLCSDNILLDCKGEAPVAKVCDFGMSRIISTGTDETSLSLPAFGHRGYLPPEATNVDSSRFDSSFDIFQFGVIMLQIVQCLPTIKSKKERNFELDQIDVTHPLKSVIVQCLSENREDRPSALQLQRKLT